MNGNESRYSNAIDYGVFKICTNSFTIQPVQVTLPGHLNQLWHVCATSILFCS